MNNPDADIDALLRDAFDGPLPDEGFTDRLMTRVPARRRIQAWPLVAGVTAGALACWMSLGNAPVLRLAWHDWLSGRWSMPLFKMLAVMAGMSLLALAWSLVEAEDR